MIYIKDDQSFTNLFKYWQNSKTYNCKLTKLTIFWCGPFYFSKWWTLGPKIDIENNGFSEVESCNIKIYSLNFKVCKNNKTMKQSIS